MNDMRNLMFLNILIAMLLLGIFVIQVFIHHALCSGEQRKAEFQRQKIVLETARPPMDEAAVCQIPAAQQSVENMPRATFDDVPDGMIP